MEIKCTKCRYKFDVTPNEGQMEMTVVCPRCGATQTLMVPPDIPVEKEIPAAPIADEEPVVAVVPPVMPSGSIPEEHMKYVPRADEAPVADDNTQMAPEKETKPVAEETPRQEKRTPKAAPVPPAKKNNSCGKMFALGCLIVAVLAILTIAILAFAGKSFFNSISSGDDDEQEQVDRKTATRQLQTLQTTNSLHQTLSSQQQQPSQRLLPILAARAMTTPLWLSPKSRQTSRRRKPTATWLLLEEVTTVVERWRVTTST